MQKPRFAVVCKACGWRGNRVQRDDHAAYGPCTSCGRYTLQRMTFYEAQRAIKAKADLAGYTPAVSTEGAS